jgi:hypothetical protein
LQHIGDRHALEAAEGLVQKHDDSQDDLAYNTGDASAGHGFHGVAKGCKLRREVEHHGDGHDEGHGAVQELAVVAVVDETDGAVVLALDRHFAQTAGDGDADEDDQDDHARPAICEEAPAVCLVGNADHSVAREDSSEESAG